ncbi:hypothetical protein FACS1894195_5470 [Bacteroidia bacterium]|nr:hypothetical protein FACS1894195_5470 [Bacteroidia bacterium]
MIPKDVGLEKFMYYLDAMNIGYLNPSEEGNRGGQTDIVNAAKEIDMSLATDIQKNVMLADYIEKRCGLSIGVTDAMRGLASPSEAVTNNQMNYTQASYILEPIFNLHNLVKRNILTAIIENAKVANAGKENLKLSYVMDDLSQHMLEVDIGLFESSTFGLFVANSGRMVDAKRTVEQLGIAAMQNNKSELSDIIRVMKAENIQEAEEILLEAEQKAQQRQEEMQRLQGEEMRKLEEQKEMYAEKQFERDKELIVLKESERRETELTKQTIFAMGFNEDKDLDKDGVPDVLELLKERNKAKIAIDRQKLEEDKLAHQIENDEAKNKIEQEKVYKNKVKQKTEKK